MPPLQHNAVLTRVAAKGFKDWDEAAAVDAQKWAGAERAYYMQRRERVNQDGGTDVLDIRELILGGDSAAAAFIDTDDVLTFTRDGGAQETGTAKLITPSQLDGFGPELATTTLELEPA